MLHLTILHSCANIPHARCEPTSFSGSRKSLVCHPYEVSANHCKYNYFKSFPCHSYGHRVCKSSICHSYENNRGVYQLFPFWNSPPATLLIFFHTRSATALSMRLKKNSPPRRTTATAPAETRRIKPGAWPRPVMAQRKPSIT